MPFGLTGVPSTFALEPARFTEDGVDGVAVFEAMMGKLMRIFGKINCHCRRASQSCS